MKDWLLRLLGAEWFKGFLSGVAATLLGFLLTMIWDIRKARIESLERDKRVMNAINEELLSNKRSLEQNRAMLQDELSALANNKSLLQPLSVMKTGFWDLAKVNLPKQFIFGDSLTLLRNLVFFRSR